MTGHSWTSDESHTITQTAWDTPLPNFQLHEKRKYEQKYFFSHKILQMLLGCHYEFKPTPFPVALLHAHGFQITNPAHVALYFSSKDAAAMKTACFHLFLFLAKHCRRQSKVFFTDFHCSWWTVAKERRE